MALPMIDLAGDGQAIRATHHLIERGESELGHQLANFARDKPHKVHDLSRVAGESPTQFRILGRHTDWTSIQMADAHHDAPEGYQRRGRKTEFFSTEERRHNHISPGSHLTVSFQRHPAA